MSTATAQSANLAYPPCQVNQLQSTPTPPKDIWFRMDPAFTDAVYRFTLYGTGTPSTTSAGMAVYEALNATSPMRLLGCATGGAYDQATNPSVEATCLTPGYKVYVRVWPRGSTAANANFNLCVMGQRTSTMPDRGADETACAARVLNPVGAFITSGSLFNYVFACDEGSFLPAAENSFGNDLWVKLLIPPSGDVRLKLSYSTASGNQIGSGSPVSGSLGISAYLSTDCSDPLQFRQVGGTSDQVTPATSGAITRIGCLPPGEFLYVRIHSLLGSMSMKKRYGQFRLEWMVGSDPAPAPDTQPCGAVPLTVGEACVGATAGTTYGKCAAPGIPAPTCGGFLGGSQGSSWYKFTAPNSGMVVIDAKAGTVPATQPAIALYASNAMDSVPGAQGCNGRLSLVSCDDRQGEGSDARIIQGALIPGQVYYVRVWKRASAPNDGNFTICVTSPTPPDGTCWYMIDMYSNSTSGVLAMEVTIPPGPTVTYTSSGGDPSEGVLVALPIGATVNFHWVSHTSTNGIGASGYIFHGLWQVGNADPIWYDDGGYAIAGPGTAPLDNFTLTDACSPPQRRATDCFGMTTVCLDGSMSGGGANTHIAGQLDNRYWPITEYSPAQYEYQGYTYHPNTGSMVDLAGPNMGCLDGEANGIQWFVFHPDQDGTVAFLMRGDKVFPTPTVQADLDFAVWDLGMLDYQGTVPDSINGYDVCPPQTPPIRCSSARNVATTGLALGMHGTEEGHGGWGWLEPLQVQAGHGYLIGMVPVDVLGRITYSLDWTMFNNSSGVPDPNIISCTPILLPVELLYLNGEPRGNVVDLTWATASEKNSSHFTVERSANGRDFTPIGQVAASGNSQFQVDYALTDQDPFNGLNYYRLRAVDLDGSTETSNTVVVVMAGGGGKMLAYPNPVEDVLRVAFSAPAKAAARMQVLDAMGRLVQERSVELEAGSNGLEMDAQRLVPGTYLVRLSTDLGGLVGAAVFVKQ